MHMHRWDSLLDITLELAKQAAQQGDVPVGAIVVRPRESSRATRESSKATQEHSWAMRESSPATQASSPATEPNRNGQTITGMPGLDMTGLDITELGITGPDANDQTLSPRKSPSTRLFPTQTSLPSTALSATTTSTTLTQSEHWEIVGTGFNQREVPPHDPSAHAEILALREAARLLGRWRLSECTLVVNLEPCAMCAGAIVNARLQRVVFGAWDPKAGAAGSLRDLLRDTRLNHQVEVFGGIDQERHSQFLQHFFHTQRGRGPH